ncbi:FAD-binding protein [Amycolatopsis jejuensis]|uniref:FAD-binding protein n=1 Tax=Amycolatopsis jejuensis TaxID=330084 RepID=UPI0009FE77CC|nr:FAD-binding protein [Amycolatopsis jejuensis]
MTRSGSDGNTEVREFGPAGETTHGRAPFALAPALEGELLVDEGSRQGCATDLGNLATGMPGAVLRPRSARDVAAMIRFCRDRGITVSARGRASTTFGQTLSEGLIIDTRSLDRIHSIGPSTAEVGAGVRWKDLIAVAFGSSPRLTPPVITGYTSLSVGGTLSVGGVGGLAGALHTGLQGDHVRELEVVTGTGEIERCSATRKRDLFEAVLGGLGQCGVITKAVLDLVPAPERARTYLVDYTDNATFFRDLRTLIERPGIDHVYATLQAPGAGATHRLNATVGYDPPGHPRDEVVLDGLSGTPAVGDTSYLDHLFTLDRLVEYLRGAADWDHLAKPWYDVWLPGTAMEDYVAEIHPALTERDLGPYGISLIYAQRRDLCTRPLPPRPAPDGSPWVYILDINTTAVVPGPDPGYAEEMLDRNRRWFTRARDRYGAVLYPIGSMRFAEQDWRTHFGAAWPAFQAAKSRYDPDGLLTPGLGIFPKTPA